MSESFTFKDNLIRDNNKVIIFDGGTGTSFQNMNLKPNDFGGDELDGCNENLILSNPSSVESVHISFLDCWEKI